MPADEFFRDILDHVFDVKGVLLAFNASVEQDLEQEIAQFFPEMTRVVMVKGVKDLIGFLKEVRFQGFVSLLQVPGASPRRAQPCHDVDEVMKGLRHQQSQSVVGKRGSRIRRTVERS